MKITISRKIMAIITLFVNLVIMSCASTGSTEAVDNVKVAIEEALGSDVTWADDFKVKSYKNLYTDDYAIYQNDEYSLFVGKYFTKSDCIIRARFEISKDEEFTGAVGKWILLDISQENRTKNGDIRELKKSDIFVSPVVDSDEKYIFLVTFHNKLETVTITPTGGVSLPGGSLRHIDRYEGWGVSNGSGPEFQEIKSNTGRVGTPIDCGMNTVIYPWVNIDKGEFTYMVLDKTNKCVHEFDLKFLGSFKE